jgi:hypothetical protein
MFTVANDPHLSTWDDRRNSLVSHWNRFNSVLRRDGCFSIRPKITRVGSQTARREVAEIRHPSLYAPRDFDISPYFMIVKPTLARGFNYKDMQWADLPGSTQHRPGRLQRSMVRIAEGVYVRIPG